jgi:hypothetical protein
VRRVTIRVGPVELVKFEPGNYVPNITIVNHLLLGIFPVEILPLTIAVVLTARSPFTAD